MYLCADERDAEEKRTRDMVRQISTTKREKEIIASIEALKLEREKIKSNKTLACPHCNKRTQLKKLTVVNAYHYIRPYSCTGGDYWTFSNEYYVVCSKCDSAVRTYKGSFDFGSGFADLSDDDKKRLTRYFFIAEYHKYFGEHLKMYEKSGTSIDLDKLRNEKKDRAERN